MKLSRIQIIIVGAGLTVIFFYSLNAVSQPDAFYHLRTGQYIIETKSIPGSDIYSYTSAGNPWIPHEWLSQIALYLVYIFFDFRGLIIFPALLAVISYFLLFRLAIKKGADPALSAIILVLLNFIGHGLWVARPQIFGYAGFTIVLILMENYRERSDAKSLVFSVVCIFIWANMHASFLLGLALIFFYLTSGVAKRVLPNKWSGETPSANSLRNLGICSLSSVLLAFLNPAGYKVFLYGYYIKPTLARFGNITEWRPLIYFWRAADGKIIIIAVISITLFIVWQKIFSGKKRDPTWAGLVAGTAILPFLSVRHAAFFPLTVFFPLSVSATEIIGANISERYKNYLPIAAIIFMILYGSSRYFTFPRQIIDPALLPVRAVDFIRKENLKGPIFNLYNEGGYLIWRLWPEEKVFIDGRSEVYGKKTIDDFFGIIGRKSGWEKLIGETYGINIFLLAYVPPSIGQATLPLNLELLKKDFHLVYWDNHYIILARRTPENAPAIRKFEFRHINPGRDPASIPKNEISQALAELNTVLEQVSGAGYVSNYAKLFLESHPRRGAKPDI